MASSAGSMRNPTPGHPLPVCGQSAGHQYEPKTILRIFVPTV
ncbi:hypothetical protein GPLA_2987 [Paraglaciecola polaris LMG 21857]|uniref:Uncharacterized protein n=1 Tax=Paraglaciecola polaris LMG 21857 TaxID=1129793 RepID=K7AF10_9ALTE|nr:hypothetical protein GPLA_2987 [Paraglaciecola polaris LMG 21857]